MKLFDAIEVNREEEVVVVGTFVVNGRIKERFKSWNIFVCLG